ncbi:hypothetical protein [Sphingobacterium sp. UBA7038]|uniref:hypothetical protein n=1 Tax=Sphingobacterium sp. UBA7038 TaxID=1947515 RepID=UPI00257D74A8|nr:hypothetical protein [Sphingobacterium sp. UBA7038]
MKFLLCLQIDPPQIIKISLEDNRKETLLEITNGIPDGISIDYQTQKIFWIVMGRLTDLPEGFSAKDGSVESCNFDGTGHTVLLGNGLITTPKQLIYHHETDRLYWCDREGMAVMTAEKDGSNLKVLVQHHNDGLADIEKQCVGIAIDPKNESLYWTQKGPSKGGKGRIFRIPLPQGDSADLSRIACIAENLPEPIDLEFGAKTGLLYWTDRGAAPEGNSLNSAIIAVDGKLSNHRIIARGLKEAIGLAVDEDENVVYTSDLGGYIRKINLTDGSENIILQLGPTTGIALLKD